jgi:hypothetical protein
MGFYDATRQRIPEFSSPRRGGDVLTLPRFLAADQLDRGLRILRFG